MLAFNREILVNFTRNMVMLNVLNYLNLSEYKQECNEKFFTRKVMVLSTRELYKISPY